MASVTLQVADRFPASTSVSAYKRSDFPGALPVPIGPPTGLVAVSTASVAADGSVTFTGLADDTKYLAYAQVGGKDLYVRFRSAPLVGSDSRISAALADSSESLPSLSPVASKTLQTLQSWLGWLASQGVKGAITEMGYPAARTPDVYHWNRVAEGWFNAIANEDLPVTMWTDAGLFAFVKGASAAGGAINAVARGAAPLLRHTADGQYRGVQVGGVVGVSPPGGFNNSNPSTGSNWYPDVASYAYLASIGVTVVRLSARWEVLQPGGPGTGALDTTAVNALKAQIAAADAAGIKVILDGCHNYASYITSGGTLHLGDGSLTQAQLVDFWTKMSTAFKGVSGIHSYELMNEPASMVSALSATVSGTPTLTPGTTITVNSTTGYPSGRNFGCLVGSQLAVLKVNDGTTFGVVDAQNLGAAVSNGTLIKSPMLLWETVSQAVVTAIRANSDTTLLLVPGYDYMAASRWRFNHPVAWITDGGSNFRYAAHNYWSSDGSGDASYGLTWAQEEAATSTAGPASVGGTVGYASPGAVASQASPSQQAAPTQTGHWTARGPMGTPPGAMTSGLLNLTYTKVRKSEAWTQTKYKILNAPSVAPTLFKIGVYEVRADGSHVLLATAVPSDTTFGVKTQAFDKTVYGRAEQLLAIAVLAVMPSGTAPALAGIPNTTPGNTVGGEHWPPVCTALSGQTDLPAYFGPNALLVSSAIYYAHGLLP